MTYRNNQLSLAEQPNISPKLLDERIGLLTGQSVPILIVSGKVCFHVPILPYLRHDDRYAV
jgi:hypothetical protein